MSDAPPPPSPPPPGGDEPPQPGYWKASDGNWYPPESRPAAAATTAPTQPPPAASTGMSGCLKAFLIVGGIAIVLFVGFVILAVTVFNRATDELGDAIDAETAPFDPDRPDAQEEDQQAQLGGSVQLAGYTATVNSAEYRAQISDFETDGYLVANVTIENRDDRSQSYNTFDWKLQTPNGQVIDPTFVTEEQLGSGDLVEGGSVSGDVVWEVGDVKGRYFLIYKPDPFNAARGIWGVTI